MKIRSISKIKHLTFHTKKHFKNKAYNQHLIVFMCKYTVKDLNTIQKKKKISVRHHVRLTCMSGSVGANFNNTSLLASNIPVRSP